MPRAPVADAPAAPTEPPGGRFRRGAARSAASPLAADADTIALYIVRRADDGPAVSSLRVHVAAIRTAHLLAGIIRIKGTRPHRRCYVTSSFADDGGDCDSGKSYPVGLTDRPNHRSESHEGPRLIPWGEPSQAWGEPARLGVIPWGEPAKLLIGIYYLSNSLVG
ncbi:MAG: hypothetical protein QOH05_518 [Acetobacteraceae bacterium]|nr:hypothetical protein [Acetobacteraceae bacterium]